MPPKKKLKPSHDQKLLTAFVQRSSETSETDERSAPTSQAPASTEVRPTTETETHDEVVLTASQLDTRPEVKTNRKFVPAWKTEFPWVYVEKDVMLCSKCVKAGKKIRSPKVAQIFENRR